MLHVARFVAISLVSEDKTRGTASHRCSAGSGRGPRTAEDDGRAKELDASHGKDGRFPTTEFFLSEGPVGTGKLCRWRLEFQDGSRELHLQGPCERLDPGW